PREPGQAPRRNVRPTTCGACRLTTAMSDQGSAAHRVGRASRRARAPQSRLRPRYGRLQLHSRANERWFRRSLGPRVRLSGGHFLILDRRAAPGQSVEADEAGRIALLVDVVFAERDEPLVVQRVLALATDHRCGT